MSFSGGSAVVLLSVLLGTRDYNGAGMDVIAAAMQGHARPEGVRAQNALHRAHDDDRLQGRRDRSGHDSSARPAGCVLGDLFGLGAGARRGGGAARHVLRLAQLPLISAIFLGVEMFGGANIQYYAIAAAISFMLSANFGLYKEQKIVYSKIRAEFINRYTD